MPQQLLDMIHNGQDIGQLWEGILAELAVRGGFGGGAAMRDPAEPREGEVEDHPEMPGGIDGGVDHDGEIDNVAAGADDDAEEEEDEDEEEGDDTQASVFVATKIDTDDLAFQTQQPSFLQNLFGRFFSFGSGNTQSPSTSQQHTEDAPDP